MESSIDIRWTGHVPGRFYFGMAHTITVPPEQRIPGDAGSGKTIESYGVHRSSMRWGAWEHILARVASDNATHRLPWISLRPPTPGVSGWKSISSGRHDRSIYELGRRLVAQTTHPAIVTFNDDPTDAAEEDGKIWAAAYCRFHDVLAAATGLRCIAEAPIIGDWLFNPENHRQIPDNWLLPEVLERSSLLGVNIYENASGETFERRMPRILDWLDSRGFPTLMLGVAASGRTEYAPPYVSPSAWLNQSLEWAARNTDRVGVVCYSSVGQFPGVYWSPNELGRAGNGTEGWIDRATIHS